MVFCATVTIVSAASSLTANYYVNETAKVSNSLAAIDKQNDLNDELDNAIARLKLSVVEVQQFYSDIGSTRGEDGLDDGFEEAEKQAKAFEVNLEEVRKAATALHVEGVDQLVSELRDRFKPYYDIGQRMAHAYVSDGTSAGNRIMSDFDKASENLQQKLDQLEAISQKFNESLNDLTETNINKAAHMTEILQAILLISGITCVGLSLATWYVADRQAMKPLSHSIEQIRALADGNLDTEIVLGKNDNEISRISAALNIFKNNALERIRLQNEQKQREQEAQLQKRKDMEQLATTFESSVKSVVDMVASAATEMDATSRSVGQTVESSKQKLDSLTQQIEGTSQNIATVSEAALQLSSAVNEINQQITRATNITNSAVDEASKADVTVQTLTEAAGKIGEVVEMINTIAAQINLLALNATIEAARAGDAGKGFAVVASEVKNLATQTTKATEQIAQFITSMQGATNDTVSAISNIGSKIREINEISTTIAAAVEEQSVSTKEIASNVQQAADSTQQVLNHSGEVTRAASETGESATQMVAATGELSRQSEILRSEVDKFLNAVRA